MPELAQSPPRQTTMSMTKVTALRRAEQYLASIANSNSKFNIFVALRNPKDVLADVQASSGSNKRRFEHDLTVSLSYFDSLTAGFLTWV